MMGLGLAVISAFAVYSTIDTGASTKVDQADFVTELVHSKQYGGNGHRGSPFDKRFTMNPEGKMTQLTLTHGRYIN